jgi:RHS repeat-associated protein
VNTYDAANRLKTVSAGGVTQVAYGYDGNGNRLGMDDLTGTTTYTYDAANRLLTQTAPQTGTVTSTYDLAGRPTTLTYPNSRVVSSTYTSQGLKASETSSGVTVTFTHDAHGRVTREQQASGATTEYTFDGAGRVATITTTPVNDPVRTISYTHDAAGNRIAQDDPQGRTVYTYDALNRLTREQPQAWAPTSYTYDAVGNRLTKAVDGQTVQSYQYNAANQLVTAAGASYTFDANGNQTERVDGGTTTTFQYDAFDRLLSVGVNGATTVSYAYNGDGLRVAETPAGGTTKRTTWDVRGLPMKLQEGASEFVWSKTGLVAESDGTTLRFPHKDVQGSIVTLTDGTGKVVGTSAFGAFGSKEQQSGTQGSQGYTGEQQDATTGLIYLRARYCDPATGRFLTEDPWRGSYGNPQTRNAYAYVMNNPTRYTDRSGRMPGESLGEAEDDAIRDPTQAELDAAAQAANEWQHFVWAINNLSGSHLTSFLVEVLGLTDFQSGGSYPYSGLIYADTWIASYHGHRTLLVTTLSTGHILHVQVGHGVYHTITARGAPPRTSQTPREVIRFLIGEAMLRIYIEDIPDLPYVVSIRINGEKWYWAFGYDPYTLDFYTVRVFIADFFTLYPSRLRMPYFVERPYGGRRDAGQAVCDGLGCGGHGGSAAGGVSGGGRWQAANAPPRAVAVAPGPARGRRGRSGGGASAHGGALDRLVSA